LAVIYFQAWIYLVVILPIIFISALLAHLIIEGNRPAAAEHPFWWSVLNDLRMLAHMLTGTLKNELVKADVSPNWF